VGHADATAAERKWTVASTDGTGPETGGEKTPDTKPAADTKAPAITLSARRRKLRAVLKSGKLVLTVSTDEAATLAGQAVLSAKLAKQLKLPAGGAVLSAAVKPAVVAKGSATASQAGAVKVVLKLTKKARKRLARVRRVTATLRVLATDAAGNRTLVTKRLKLKR